MFYVFILNNYAEYFVSFYLISHMDIAGPVNMLLNSYNTIFVYLSNFYIYGCVCVFVLVGGSLSEGLLTQFTEPSLGDRCHRITSVAYSHDSTEVLVSYSSQHIYLFGLKVAVLLCRYYSSCNLLHVSFLWRFFRWNWVSWFLPGSCMSDATKDSVTGLHPLFVHWRKGWCQYHTKRSLSFNF